jgi:hypothetical protein
MNLEQFKKDVAEGKIKDKWYFYKRTEGEKNALVRDMESLALFIKDKFNLDIYLVYGTLLGAIREQDFIKHDNDVDFAYLSKQNNIKDVLQEFYGITMMLKNHDILAKVCSNGHAHVYSPNKRNVFDLWTSYIIENQYYLVPLFNGDIDSSVILPLKQLSFKEKILLIPNQPKLLLDATYHTWQKPILDDKGIKNKWKKII